MSSDTYGKLRYADIKDCDMVNGEGVRVSLYVTGCSHACDGCFNASLLNPKNGELFTDDTMGLILDLLRPDFIQGLTFLGGDPLYKRNLKGVQRIIDEVKSWMPNKDIWLWSGYTLDQLNDEQRKIVESVDMFIDGRYIKDMPTKKPWRGSDNQVQYKIVNSIPVKII